MCQYSHTQKKEVENKLDSIVQTRESFIDKAEVDETTVDEMLTHIGQKTFIYTSTPKKRKLQCKGCSIESLCDDCLDDYVENNINKNKLTR